MSRVILILAMTCAGGCGSSGSASKEVAPITASNAESPQPVSAFEFDKEAGIISLNSQIPPPQRRRFDIGQGSVTLETVGIEDGKLTFQYTPEIEGGYTTYECTVPVSSTPITIKVNADGTPGDTSFDLSKCKVIRSGNFLLDQAKVGEPANAPVPAAGPDSGGASSPAAP
jgi:hypothetical protein